MRKLYTFENASLAGYFCHLLNGHGIECVVRNWFVAGEAAGSSPLEHPELWVVHDADEAAARDQIREALADTTDESPSWRCGVCDVSVPGGYAWCWRCNRAKNAQGGA